MIHAVFLWVWVGTAIFIEETNAIVEKIDEPVSVGLALMLNKDLKRGIAELESLEVPEVG